MNPTKRVAALAISAVAIAAACSGGASPSPSAAASAAASAASSEAPVSPSAEPLTGSYTVDGSSTVFPLTAAVAEDFQKANPGATVTVNESGTGGGFKKFCAGETDMNDASRPIKADDAGEGKACTTNNITYTQLQIAWDGIAVVVNPQNTWATCLTSAQLKTIYGPDSPENLKWSDVDPAWPAETVVRFMPGADSGTFDFFTAAINGKEDSSTQHATTSEDDNIMVTGVAGDKDAIAYFGYSYAASNTGKITAVQVDGGTGCIAPSPETITTGTYKPLTRPLFIYPNLGTAKDKAGFAGFVDYYLANAITLAADPGVLLVGLTDDQLKTTQDAWTAAMQ